MKNTPLCILFITLVLGCTSNNQANSQDCPPGINLLPMFGNAKKCREQLEADQQFLKEADAQFKDRKLAAAESVKGAWKYYYSKQPDLAMKRFNQAWLLDSLNAEVYWGFANLTGMQEKYQESLSFFRKARQLDPSNSKIWESASVSFGQLYVKTGENNLLDSSIYYLKTAIKLKPDNASAHAQLAAAYTYTKAPDSAKKYLKLADKLNKEIVNPAVRAIIEKY